MSGIWSLCGQKVHLEEISNRTTQLGPDPKSWPCHPAPARKAKSAKRIAINRSPLAQHRRPQADETDINHTTRSNHDPLKTNAQRQSQRRNPVSAVLCSHRASKGLPHPAAPRTAGQPASSLTLEIPLPHDSPYCPPFWLPPKLPGDNGRTCRTHPNRTAPQAPVVTDKPFIITIMSFVRQARTGQPTGGASLKGPPPPQHNVTECYAKSKKTGPSQWCTCSNTRTICHAPWVRRPS